MIARHNLFPHEPVKARLTSRKSFVTVSPLTDPPETARINQWTDNWSDEDNKSNLKKFCLDPIETLPTGNKLPWRVWRTANRVRSGHAATPAAKYDWGYQSNASCRCGAQRCDIDHLMNDCDYYGTRPTIDDITSMNDIAYDGWMTAVADTI